LVEKSAKLVGFPRSGQVSGAVGRRREEVGRRPRLVAQDDELDRRPTLEIDHGEAGRYRMEPLVAEWLLDLRVQGRAERTLKWYREKLDDFLRRGQATTLADLTAAALRQHLAAEQARGLAENTVHGSFQSLHAFGSWASRENYPVDPALLRVRAPKVSQKEMEVYSVDQLEAIFRAVPPGWPQVAVQILLGTGMRVSELCDLTVEDIEDDGEATTLKIRRGKGAKFRRAPVSSRLRRELVRYLNRSRPLVEDPHLLIMRGDRPVRVVTVTELFQRVRQKVGFPVHAHKFRHTFATEYLRRGGEIERLRRILGHTTYVMVMRYVHLDKGDLCRDFDLRSPF
jgi:integrase/recombinase XerD